MANQIIEVYERLTKEAEDATEATRESITSLLK
jgi:hypothetical protein